MVTHKLTGKQFAMKTVDISSVEDPKEFEFFMKEVRNICHLSSTCEWLWGQCWALVLTIINFLLLSLNA